MWVLDPSNSRDLLDLLRPHSSSGELEVVWCGEGWRSLVRECHDELVAAFPDYRFTGIKQKWGVLMFSARPRAGAAMPQEELRVDTITERYSRASATICEWCGGPGSLREDVLVSGRREDLTLCDSCLADMAGSSYPSVSPPN